MDATNDTRAALTRAQRIVVKIGSKALLTASGDIDTSRISSLVAQLAALQKKGIETLLVSSGAIAVGRHALKIAKRPRDIETLQLAASVGQPALFHNYYTQFGTFGIAAAQFLLTHADLHNRIRHLHARNALLAALRRGIVPIINENDVVSVDEIQFGDNDQLAAMVGILIDADAVVLLSTVDGVEDRSKTPYSRVADITNVQETISRFVVPEDDSIGTGGMQSKLLSAAMCQDAGIACLIADGTNPEVLAGAVAGADIGTYIPPQTPRRDAARKRWIAFFHRARGDVIVDAGAAHALLTQKRSLLPIGISEIRGNFGEGELVTVRTTDGSTLGRGLVSFDANTLRSIRGKNSSQIEEMLGRNLPLAAIHRDNLVLESSE